MTDTVTLNLKIDHEAVDATIAAFDRLTASIERAAEAIQKLDGAGHGGIKIEAVGSVMVCTVLPVDQVLEDMESVEDSICKGARRAERRFKL